MAFTSVARKKDTIACTFSDLSGFAQASVHTGMVRAKAVPA